MLRSSFWRQLRVALMTGLLLGGLGAALAYQRTALRVPEFLFYDQLERLAAPHLPPAAQEQILMLGIDDASIDDLRNVDIAWPWPRSLIGRAVDELKVLGAKVVVLDTLYYDARPVSDEREFVESLRRAGNVVVDAQTAVSIVPPPPRPGRWSARLEQFSDQEHALRFAADLAMEQHTGYFVPGEDGGVGVWLSGYTSRRATEQGLDALAGIGDIQLDHQPEIRELSLQELKFPIDSSAWLGREAVDVAGKEALEITSPEELLLPRPEVMDAAKRVGFGIDTARQGSFDASDFDAVPDDDADLPTTDAERSVRLLIQHRDAANGLQVYPSLALATLLAIHPGKLSVRDGRLHYGEGSVPLSRRGFMYLNYPADETVFAQDRHHIFLSFSTILRNADRRDRKLTTDPAVEAAVKGKVVIVANVASDLFDHKSTLRRKLYFGSAVEAVALRTLLLGDAVLREPRERDARLAFLLGMLGALYALVVFRYARSTAFIFIGGVGMVAGVALYFGYALHMFVDARTWVACFTPMSAFVLAAFGTGWINYGETANDRARVAEALGRFTSPAIVESVLRRPMLIAPKRAELTILFSDIAGFTTISESMPAPRLAELLGTYFTEMAQPIAAAKGHVDKFIGDAIMAFWNAPLPQEKHAALACRAALQMRDRLVKLTGSLRKEYAVEVSARIGLNTGEVVVGELGAKSTRGEAKMNYTCLGDAVNLASRLEGLNRQYGTTILCGPRTVALAGEAFVFRELDRVRVKGKQEAVAVHELVAAKGDKLDAAHKECLASFAAGLAAYRAREFEKAQGLFEAALRAVPTDGPSQTLRDRCVAYLREPPPADWDGAFVQRDK